MQKIEYKESPSPHVIVQNFLSIPAARECLEEAQWLEPVYIDASTFGSPEDSDGCEECESKEAIIKKGVRSNQVVYLDIHYADRRLKSKILQHLEQAIRLPFLLETFYTLPNLFPIITQTTHMETILSSYGKCDFYGWHKDVLPDKPAARILTCVLHFNTEPQQYEGGELILSGKTIEDQLPYPPVHNTAIFFESNKLVHAVDETSHEGEFKDSRFSINLWLGFEKPEDANAHKYR
jgi:Rps23 Pro-64 3,4-dihydroxylase Tpa1-like proline 4-hydroxylase|tara:strand:- start:343 stop:1050 length:708 start_codon:yes stop_codon:yes gene_type:complete